MQQRPIGRSRRWRDNSPVRSTGLTGIPERWIDRLAWKDRLLAAALKLLADESTLSPRVAWSIADADG